MVLAILIDFQLFHFLTIIISVPIGDQKNFSVEQYKHNSGLHLTNIANDLI
jgi:hypothetical protein